MTEPSSQIDMFFRFPTGMEFRVPVIPKEIQISDGSIWHRINVLGLGEIAIPAFRKTMEISFTSFFPYLYDPGYCQYGGLAQTPLMHPADASNLFNVAMGTKGVRPSIVRFLMIEEYAAGIWTTWIDDLFAIESFTKTHKSMVDQDYTILLRSVRTATLQATGALEDNIGTQKPHPVRSGTVDPNLEVTTGDTTTRIGPRMSPTNWQLTGGVDPSDVSNKLAGGGTYTDKFAPDKTQPIGGSAYSATDPDAQDWGNDSSASVTLSNNVSNNYIGNPNAPYLDPGYTVRDEYVNRGGTLFLKF